jgi:hypothetical protein
MQESEQFRHELESKTQALKQLEGVYKTSTNLSQKKRVLQEINRVKNLIQNLRGKLLIKVAEEDDEFFDYETFGSKNGAFGSKSPGSESFRSKDFSRSDAGLEGEREDPLQTAPRGYSLLNYIPIIRHREDSRDREIDVVVSYVDFFEKNYLPLLSDYYIKFNFSHSIKRDTFYPRHMEIKKILKEYNYELDVLNREEFDSIAHSRDKSVVHKVRRRYLLLLDKYYKDLRDFLGTVVDDIRTGGNMVLNPHDPVNLSEFEDNRRLDGLSVSDILEEMRTFSDEFTRFLSLPDI